MTDRMPLANRSRTFKNVWLLAGGLLVASGIFTAFASTLFVPEELMLFLGGFGIVFYAAGGVLFALGFRGEGSVTARKPLGTWAIIGLVGALPVVRTFVWGSIPVEVYYSGLLYVFTAIDLAIELAIAIVAAVAIARAGVVPAPWCWAPIGAVAVAAVAEVTRILLGINGTSTGTVGDWIVSGLIPALIPIVLGAIAIVLVLPRRAAR